jgi:hypothetical protein
MSLGTEANFMDATFADFAVEGNDAPAAFPVVSAGFSFSGFICNTSASE